MKKDCLFCEIVKGKLPSKPIYENAYVYAFLDIAPDSDGHTLVVPKMHSQDLITTSDEYLIQVAIAKKNISILLKEKMNSIKGFNYLSNQGEIALQSIFHYHEHIIPKYEKGFGYFHDKKIKLKHSVEEIYQKLK